MTNKSKQPGVVFFVEVTDTFNGAANFCWSKRFMVHGCTSVRGAARKVAKHCGYPSVRVAHREDSGGGSYDVVGMCVRMFIEDVTDVCNWVCELSNEVLA
jgi:hypothetical protein